MTILRANVTSLHPIPWCTSPLRFINGYINRREAKTTDNTEYLAFVRQSYLNRLKLKLPQTVLDKTTWLTAPTVCEEVDTPCMVGSMRDITLRKEYLPIISLILYMFMFRPQLCCVKFTCASWCGSMWEASQRRRRHRWRPNPCYILWKSPTDHKLPGLWNDLSGMTSLEWWKHLVSLTSSFCVFHSFTSTCMLFWARALQHFLNAYYELNDEQ